MVQEQLGQAGSGADWFRLRQDLVLVLQLGHIPRILLVAADQYLGEEDGWGVVSAIQHLRLQLGLGFVAANQHLLPVQHVLDHQLGELQYLHARKAQGRLRWWVIGIQCTIIKCSRAIISEEQRSNAIESLC